MQISVVRIVTHAHLYIKHQSSVHLRRRDRDPNAVERRECVCVWARARAAAVSVRKYIDLRKGNAVSN